jgi:SAM-dependent methyltransferase
MTPTAHNHHDTPAHHHGHGHGHGSDVDGQAEILELDAEVLAEHTASITAWLPLAASPRQVVDLGCGTGAGTFALLDRFPEAHVTAVDSSADHLRRLREKAQEHGVADRVRTVQADLDSTWPELGEPDLVWASASLHHMTDPDRVLRQVRDTLAPGGLFAVVELAGFPRFLPDDAPEEHHGLEQRCHAASDRRHAEHLPHRGADWGAKLTAAGFTLEGQRTITVDIGHSRSTAVGRYALSGLRRMRDAAADRLTTEDLAALDQLLDTGSPHSILRRDDLAVRTERAVWAARRV